MSDRIEKQVELRAPIERVWRAISDHEEFGSWFKVRLDGPFVAGAEQTGQMTYPGYEHLPWKARIVAVEPPHRLAFEWPAMDERNQVREDWPWTLVEFRLDRRGEGTLLTVVETGFDALPEAGRAHAFRMNDGGWTEQMRFITAYVDG
jgi:uncharacterized protein YndB with AHSA1/START domain